MFALNRDEKKALLIILACASVGLCVRFAVKMHRQAGEFIAIERSITHFDANQITLEELLRARVLPRKTAEALISFRHAHGPFRGMSDLKDVPGIGEYRFQKLKSILYVD